MPLFLLDELLNEFEELSRTLVNYLFRMNFNHVDNLSIPRNIRYP